MDIKSTVIGITRRLPRICEERVNNSYSVNWGDDAIEHDHNSILSLAENATGLIVTPAERIDAALIEALPSTIKVISCFSVGYEHIAIDSAKAFKIIVTNTPGVLTEATADIAMLLILGAARRASEGERLIRSGKWGGWRPTQLLGNGLSGKTLGVLGMGRIGCAVARRAQGFGLKVAYHNRNRLPGNQENGAQFIELAEELIALSNVLSLHMPLTPETDQFLNQERLALLPQNAIVINSGRGPLIDDDALITALQSGGIAAAGLDVYTGEPELDRRYLDLDNVFLLPHLGSATNETREAMGMLAIDNLDAVIAAEEPKFRVV